MAQRPGRFQELKRIGSWESSGLFPQRLGGKRCPEGSLEESGLRGHLLGEEPPPLDGSAVFAVSPPELCADFYWVQSVKEGNGNPPQSSCLENLQSQELVGYYNPWDRKDSRHD